MTHLNGGHEHEYYKFHRPQCWSKVGVMTQSCDCHMATLKLANGSAFEQKILVEHSIYIFYGIFATSAFAL